MAYAKRRCTVYNLYYLAYEKGFAAETLSSNLYSNYQREGLQRAELLNLPKAIKGLEPSAWQVNRPTSLWLQQHTSQRIRGLQDAEQPLLSPLQTSQLTLDVPAHNRTEAPRGLTSGLAPNDAGHLYTLHTSLAKVGYFTDIRLSNLTTPDPDHLALLS